MSITECKKLETALKESNPHFRVLFESAPIAIAILNTEGRVVQTNPASREMFRNVKVNPWRAGFSEVTCLDYLEENAGLFQQLLQGKSDHCRIEKCFKQTDGNYAWYLIVLSALRGANGEVQYLIGMIEDITERKRAEEAKQESEEHFRTLFELASIGIVGLDAQGHIIQTNRVFRDMLGYRNSDFHGFSITDNTHPGDVDESRRLWKKLCEGQCDHYCIEQRYYRRDRELIWVRMALSAVRDVQGKCRYAVGMVEDITERKREEEQSNTRIAAIQTEVHRLRHQVGIHYKFDNIIGRSDAMKQVFKLMQKAIESDLTVLLTGETGTGKELVAKAIHYNSLRKNKPFLDLNCGAVPHELVASTLFGHRKGAFTGAHQDNPGLFVSADGGTVFLDEIVDMPLEAQIHLLRVLQEGTVQCVGEPRSRSVDVRLIASTNQNLLHESELT